MVLVQAVGRPRPFWQGFLLTVATFGVYSFYWDIKSHQEVYQQFELRREGRDDGLVWYVMGFVLPVIRFVYYYYYTSNVQYLRQRFGYRDSITPTYFLALVIPAQVLIGLSLVGLIVASAGVDVDDAGDIVDTDPTLIGVGLGLAAFGFLGFAILMPVAYARLQGNVNDLWAAYHHRMNQIRPKPTTAPAPETGAPQSGPRSVASTGS